MEESLWKKERVPGEVELAICRAGRGLDPVICLHGITAPITLETTFNGGYASFALDPSGSCIGFSARGSLMRSAFGIAFGIPAPGSTMGVGDAVEIIIEAEFTRPPTAPP